MRSLLVSALVLVAVVIAPCALAACYHEGDPLPPCSASDTACGGYPERRATCTSVDLDSGVRDDAGGWHYKAVTEPCE